MNFLAFAANKLLFDKDKCRNSVKINSLYAAGITAMSSTIVAVQNASSSSVSSFSKHVARSDF